MRSVRHSHHSEVEAGDEESDALPHKSSPLQNENCAAEGSDLSLWFADIVLAIGCFAVVTAAGQLPFTAPRLLQAISSVRIATTAKRSATQRETKQVNGGAKLRDEDADSKTQLPAVATLN